MKLRREKKLKKERKSYDISQSALYNTSSKAKLAAIFSTDIKEVIRRIGDYRRFELIPELDPFKLGKPPKVRQVQKPAPKLLAIHERILRLLRCVQVPEYMQFALKGTSYKNNAEMHLSGKCVATLDIRNFFGSTSKSKVFNFFSGPLKATGDVANLYADLTTFDNYLPTGSPLSPLLSFYANKSLFDDLNIIATEHGLTFTCYVDDLTFSGESISRRFLWQIENTIRQYGHVVASKKTRLFKDGIPKHITGVVVHEGSIRVPNVRYRKMRLIKEAIHGSGKNHGLTRKELEYKLGGLLGEAAYLDPSNLPAAIEFGKTSHKNFLKAITSVREYAEPPKPNATDEKFNPPWHEQGLITVLLSEQANDKNEAN